jgi:hypothetical protein
MLAPPARRARDRRLKRRQRARERQDLHRVELWLSGRALGGLIAMLIRTGKLTDQAAADRIKLDAALAALLEQQGLTWTT